MARQRAGIDMEKMTRKEWAHVYGVDYQTLANALHRYSGNGQYIPNQLFDGESVRGALVKYYEDRRMKYIEKASRLDMIIENIQAKKL